MEISKRTPTATNGRIDGAAGRTECDGRSKKGIVYIPDIFGPLPNAFHGADILAEKGFLVVMPDFFRGGEWSLDDFPPKDGFGGEPFQNFINGLQYADLKDRIERAVAILHALGATSIGAVGFCWGGNLAMRALADGDVGGENLPAQCIDQKRCLAIQIAPAHGRNEMPQQPGGEGRLEHDTGLRRIDLAGAEAP